MMMLPKVLFQQWSARVEYVASGVVAGDSRPAQRGRSARAGVIERASALESAACFSSGFKMQVLPGDLLVVDAEDSASRAASSFPS